MIRPVFLDEVADDDLPRLLEAHPEPEARALVRDELNARSLSPQHFATVRPTENPENPMPAAKIEAVPAPDAPLTGSALNLHLWGPRLGPMVDEYEAWCDENKLPRVSADEQDSEALTPEQYDWNIRFIHRWDEAQAADDAESATAKTLQVPTRAEDEDFDDGEKAGFAAFVGNLALSFADKFAPELRDGWRRGWWFAHARCYGQGVKAALLHVSDDDPENPYPQFSTAGEAWSSGHDETDDLPAPVLHEAFAPRMIGEDEEDWPPVPMLGLRVRLDPLPVEGGARSFSVVDSMRDSVEIAKIVENPIGETWDFAPCATHDPEFNTFPAWRFRDFAGAHAFAESWAWVVDGDVPEPGA